jgi:hypothetical protein
MSIRLWLRDDHHTLSMLARRRGIREAALLHTLTDRWRGRVPTARYRDRHPVAPATSAAFPVSGPDTVRQHMQALL